MKKLFIILFLFMTSFCFADSKDYCKIIADFMNDGKYVVIYETDNNEEGFVFISRQYVKMIIIEPDKLYIDFDDSVDYNTDFIFNKDEMYVDEKHNLHLNIIE